MADTLPLTGLFHLANEGDETAPSRIFSLVYGELRAIARRERLRRRPNHPLQSIDLVNEAYLKLTAGNARALKENRAFFYAAAARAMRQVLIDHDRRWRPPRSQRSSANIPDRACEDPSRLRALDRAINDLYEVKPSLAQIVDLRFFAGHTNLEVAELLNIGVATVQRRFRVARAYLHSRVEEYLADDSFAN